MNGIVTTCKTFLNENRVVNIWQYKRCCFFLFKCAYVNIRYLLTSILIDANTIFKCISEWCCKCEVSGTEMEGQELKRQKSIKQIMPFIPAW